MRGRPTILGDRRGAVAILAALLLVPLTLVVGSAVDFARLAKAQVSLQDAVDAAALSGAAAFSDPNQGPNAAAVATRFFNSYAFASDLSVPAAKLSVNAAQGTLPSGGNSYNVTVTAKATLNATIMSLASFHLFSLSATATAANPIVVPLFSLGHFGASAADWNSLYMYAVPSDSKGNPEWTYTPTSSDLYEIGSNCNSSSQNYSRSSRCNGQTGATVSTKQVFPTITATQPIAIALQNVTNGLYASASAGYGSNGYGSPDTGVNVFSTAYEAGGLSPSQYTNYSYNVTTCTKTRCTTKPVSTHYPTTATSSTSNCSVIIQQVDPKNLPATPPYTGKCASPTSTQFGAPFAGLSCAKMAGRTFMYWWNDMGGPSDDGDYNDAYFTISCSLGTSSTTGISSGNASTAAAGLSVVLFQ